MQGLLRGLTAFTLAALALPNCTGHVQGGPSPAPLAAAGTSGQQPGSTNLTAPPGSVFVEAYERGAEPESLRRLSTAEYLSSVGTAFPGLALPPLELPQDGSLAGYARASDEGVTDSNLKIYLEAAQKIAAALTANLPVTLGSCDPASSGMRGCVEVLIDTRLGRLFRRPVDPATRTELLALFDDAQPTLQASDLEALELVLTRALMSPRFLYEIAIGAPAPELGEGMRRLDGYEVAARVAYGLLRASPDDALFEAASQGLLADPDALREQGQRLLAAPQGRSALWSFHRQWLFINRLDGVMRDPARFPELTPELRAAMAAESAAFVDAVTSQGPGAFHDLLAGRFSFLSQPLAGIYGVSTTSAQPTRFELPPGSHRAGLLSQPSFLTANASDHDDRRRVFRGSVIRKRLLCTELPAPPPSAVTTVVEDRVTDGRCASCHSLMDLIGVGFDGFDAIGRWLGSDPTQGTIFGGADLTGDFADSEALAEMLAGSGFVQGCYLQHWVSFALGRQLHAPDTATLERLHETFHRDLDIEALLLGMVASDMFYTRYSPSAACEGGAL